jgi:hypothetical protein
MKKKSKSAALTVKSGLKAGALGGANHNRCALMR